MRVMYVLPDPPECPDCGADNWTKPSYAARIRRASCACRSCGFVQHLLTDTKHWLREQAEIDAEIASGA